MKNQSQSQKSRSRSASSHYSLYDEFTKTAAFPLRRYINLSSPPNPHLFGFGSASPARPPIVYNEVPGPGRYDPRSASDHTLSTRGVGPGFTSHVPRRLDFVRGNKNPGPSSYSPSLVDRRIKPRIGAVPKGRLRVTCFPEEREEFNTPGPGSYDVPEERARAPSSMFKSRSKRQYLIPARREPQPRFDGRNLVVRITDNQY